MTDVSVSINYLLRYSESKTVIQSHLLDKKEGFANLSYAQTTKVKQQLDVI